MYQWILIRISKQLTVTVQIITQCGSVQQPSML